MKGLLIPAIICVCLLGGCTGRRTASQPVPDGDTIEVVIPEGKHHNDYRPIRIIEVEEEAVTPPDSTSLVADTLDSLL